MNIEENSGEYSNPEKNYIVLAVHFQTVNNQREVHTGLININERQMLISQFLENEFYSNLESLVVQSNPQNDYTQFYLLINYPPIKSEKEKIEEIMREFEIEVKEKDKNQFSAKGFIQDIQQLMNKPLQQMLEANQMEMALRALSCAINHLELMQDEKNCKQFSLDVYKLSNYMKLDKAALNALQILPKNQENLKGAENQSANSIVGILDKCKTQIGSRLLKRWIKQPLQDIDEIIRRQNIVAFFTKHADMTQDIQNKFLKKIPDLDKLYSKFYKVHSERKQHGATLVDCIKVYQIVKNLEWIYGFLQNLVESDQLDENEKELVNNKYIDQISNILNDCKQLVGLIDKAVAVDKAYSGEYMIKPEFSQELRELDKQMQEVEKRIDQVKSAVEKDLGEPVKIIESNSYTKLFEIKKKVGDAAFRESKQTYKQVNVKKGDISFTNDKLQDCVSDYIEILDEYKQKQKGVIDKILKLVSTYYPAMEKASAMISEMDVLVSFSILPESNVGYVMPNINQKGYLNLQKSKHPILQIMDSSQCVANDCVMVQGESKFHIITGPNMGGKSTFIRQVGICVLLAHIGCYVPCAQADIPLMDAIITRVGASDIQLKGISTFMQEMLEASCMLKIATKNSLIIIDELGRGTATNEGFGLAWGIAQYIVEDLDSFCLFATHFHEMTKLADVMPQVKNYHVSVKIQDDQLTMLYKVKEGPVDRSYGLFVARMLKFPQEIIIEAEKKAAELEQYENFITKTQVSDASINEQERQQLSEILAGKVKNQIGLKENSMNIENIQENLDEIKLLDIAKKATMQQKIEVIQFVNSQLKTINTNNQRNKQEFFKQMANQIKIILQQENE